MHRTAVISVLSALVASSLAVPTTGKLAKRDCDGLFGDDPTKTLGDFTGCTSQYQDGSGTYVTSADQYTYGFATIGDYCWTDVFYVSVDENAWGDWQPFPDAGAVDCASTSTCSMSKTVGTSDCQTWSMGKSTAVDFGITNSVVSASLTTTTTQEYQHQQCTTQSTQISCNWSDQAEHTVSYRTPVARTYGYIRRRCNWYQDNPDLGDVTVWSHDFSIDTPRGSREIGCDAQLSKA